MMSNEKGNIINLFLSTIHSLIYEMEKKAVTRILMLKSNNHLLGD